MKPRRVARVIRIGRQQPKALVIETGSTARNDCFTVYRSLYRRISVGL